MCLGAATSDVSSWYALFSSDRELEAARSRSWVRFCAMAVFRSSLNERPAGRAAEKVMEARRMMRRPGSPLLKV